MPPRTIVAGAVPPITLPCPSGHTGSGHAAFDRRRAGKRCLGGRRGPGKLDRQAPDGRRLHAIEGSEEALAEPPRFRIGRAATGEGKNTYFGIYLTPDAKRRFKLACWIVGLLFLLLTVSVVSNYAMIFSVVDSQVR